MIILKVFGVIGLICLASFLILVGILLNEWRQERKFKKLFGFEPGNEFNRKQREANRRKTVKVLKRSSLGGSQKLSGYRRMVKIAKYFGYRIINQVF